MSAAQFCVNWDSHKKTVLKGFSHLQQNAEFVDMTLAADGHLVKVHQNIVALASPYLKAMLQSATCPHPVIFLNNISREVLGFILEYIYTGETMVPTDSLNLFIGACKALHLTGIGGYVVPKNVTAQPVSVPQESNIEKTQEAPDTNYAAHITINSENYNLEVTPIENTVMENIALPFIPVDNETLALDPISGVYSISGTEQINIISDNAADDINMDIERPSCPEVNDSAENQSQALINSNNDNNITDPSQQPVIMDVGLKQIAPLKRRPIKPLLPSKTDTDKVKLYTLSNRGSLQLLLDRYMYYCHHQSCGGRLRRWRCIDYRKLRCQAFIDTDSDKMIHRSEAHSHSYHDNKINKKIKFNSVFTTLLEADEHSVKLKKEERDLRVLATKNKTRKQKPSDGL